jgi:hypothetical protein
MVPFDVPAARPYTDLLTEDEMEESWQWIEPNGTRFMETAAALRLIESAPAVRWMASVIRTLRLTWLVGLVNEFSI